ncbi:hypothetical protein SASPL_135325 [Salvia splendens]|uniref:Uncharacterized protein n=1 Tax=Salvia splendens TaxID=180675 RepID=A0A8X8ZFV4_SALSN|nr:hypothetical protein SASPL_135325 [Salvia splendens]
MYSRPSPLGPNLSMTLGVGVVINTKDLGVCITSIEGWRVLGKLWIKIGIRQLLKKLEPILAHHKVIKDPDGIMELILMTTSTLLRRSVVNVVASSAVTNVLDLEQVGDDQSGCGALYFQNLALATLIG